MKQMIKIRVLGCHGGEMEGFASPSLLIGERVLLDAGSFGTVLSLNEQLKLDHILISHAHHDHVKDLAGFADLIIGHRSKPVLIHATAGALDVLRHDFFNNRLWPDFFSLPSPQGPVLRGVELAPRRELAVGTLRVRAVPVHHPVESVGFIVRGPTGSFVYTGDTGPTEELWLAVNRLRKLRLLMIETKFPNELQVVANAAGHLTPKTLAAELAKIRANSVPIVIYHIKPDRFETVVRQLNALGDGRIRIMRIGDRFEF